VIPGETGLFFTEPTAAALAAAVEALARAPWDPARARANAARFRADRFQAAIAAQVAAAVAAGPSASGHG